MKIRIIAVGSKMPAWVEAGIEEYRKRLPQEFSFAITEMPLAARSKNSSAEAAREKEAQGIKDAIGKQDYVVALDVKGASLGTESMAEAMTRIRDAGQNLSILIGGPDGLADSCLHAADARWSLSALTFPHPIVRIVLAEQLYRIWSILNRQPYHRS